LKKVKNIFQMERHEGAELRNYLKGMGLEMQDVAEKLEMSRQNLNYHLRKQVLDEDFRRLAAEKMKIDFPLVKRSSNIQVTAPLDRLIGEMAEQLAANTAILNVLRPIVEELYAAHRNQPLLKIRIELNNLISDEGRKILDLIQKKWKGSV
jgi:hypothetical protein